MAKQIKVIKCPHCGNSNNTDLGNEHYRCTKCGTEFFLDSDDININVNHNFGTQKPWYERIDSQNIIVGFIASFVFVLLIFFVSFISTLSRPSRSIPTTYSSRPETPEKQTVSESFYQSVLLTAKGKAVVFYLSKRETRPGYDELGVYAVFRDATTGKFLKSEKRAEFEPKKSHHITGRFFDSDSTFYAKVGDDRLYVIDPVNLTFTDITEDLCSRKPALKNGISHISINRWDEGDGFELTTNLGKKFHYYPGPDDLYSDDANRYVANGENGSAENAKKMVTYMFKGTESDVSANMIQVQRVVFNNNGGGPEIRISDWNLNFSNSMKRFRVSSMQNIGEKFIGFKPRSIYESENQVMILYDTTVADDAKQNVILLDAKGNLIWSVAIPVRTDPRDCNAIRTSTGYIIKLKENAFLEVSIDGKHTKSHVLSTEVDE